MKFQVERVASRRGKARIIPPADQAPFVAELLLVVGVVVAAFVGFNIGGSSTGVAFGPAVGSNTVSKVTAAGLMSFFALLGGWTVGRNVIDTMGGQIVPASTFTTTVSIVVLFFIGFALFLSNTVGVPASTSMTAVGAIAGLGIATGRLDWAVMGRIVSWWIVSPVVAFWVSGVVGRYFYPRLAEWFAVTQTEGALLALDRSGTVPRLVLGPNTTGREAVGTVLVVAIACYMAFSAGASNVANAVAPLVGNGTISMTEGILLGGGAIGVGAFTIARRTLETVGNDLTEMPLLAALVVAVVSATLVTFLSAIGIPASFVIIATMSIVGLGWGRATRTVTISDAVHGDTPGLSVGGIAAESEESPTVGDTSVGPSDDHPAPIGDERSEDIPAAADLFEPRSTARVILTQNLVPALATVAAYLVFRFAPIA
jgi:PiT family inorganic phosphate transporter